MVHTVTRGKWGFGGTLSSDGHFLSCYIRRPGYLFKDGKSRFQWGDWDNYQVPSKSYDEYQRIADEIGLRHGYIQPYGRNLGKFVQSRAARKRGYVCTDSLYLSRQARLSPKP